MIALICTAAQRDHFHLLNAGIEASFSRPFAPSNLLDHLRGLVGINRAAAIDGVVTYGDIEMNTATHQVRRDGRSIRLSPTEFKLLRHFLQRPEQVISRDQLKEAAWNLTVHVETRTIDVHVGRLRKALRTSTGGDVIRTVRSVGYALSEKDLAG